VLLPRDNSSHHDQCLSCSRMGSCLSKSGQEENEPKKRPRSAYNLKDERGQFKTSAQKEEFNESKWEEDTRSIWNRPLSQLSCHMDLPRLGHKMKIFHNEQPVSKSEEEMEGAGKMQVVLDIIMTIAENCGETPELMEDIRNRYYQFVNEDGSGDLSQQLKAFLEEVIPENSRLCSILSLCHQKIVFPAYYTIKQKVHDQLAFKDSRGSWNINVFLTEETCTVVHSKVQMAKDCLGDAEPEFSFRWELVVTLRGESLESMDNPLVRIADVTTRANLPVDRAQQIQRVFETSYPNN